MQDAELGEEANKMRAEIAKNWRRDHNAYTLRKYLPKSPTDVTDASGFLSMDPAARDFARIAEEVRSPVAAPAAIGRTTSAPCRPALRQKTAIGSLGSKSAAHPNVRNPKV